MVPLSHEDLNALDRLELLKQPGSLQDTTVDMDRLKGSGNVFTETLARARDPQADNGAMIFVQGLVARFPATACSYSPPFTPAQAFGQLKKTNPGLQCQRASPGRYVARFGAVLTALIDDEEGMRQLLESLHAYCAQTTSKEASAIAEADYASLIRRLKGESGPLSLSAKLAALNEADYVGDATAIALIIKRTLKEHKDSLGQEQKMRLLRAAMNPFIPSSLFGRLLELPTFKGVNNCQLCRYLAAPYPTHFATFLPELLKRGKPQTIYLCLKKIRQEGQWFAEHATLLALYSLLSTPNSGIHLDMHQFKHLYRGSIYFPEAVDRILGHLNVLDLCRIPQTAESVQPHLMRFLRAELFPLMLDNIQLLLEEGCTTSLAALYYLNPGEFRLLLPQLKWRSYDAPVYAWFLATLQPSVGQLASLAPPISGYRSKQIKVVEQVYRIIAGLPPGGRRLDLCQPGWEENKTIRRISDILEEERAKLSPETSVAILAMVIQSIFSLSPPISVDAFRLHLSLVGQIGKYAKHVCGTTQGP